VSELLWETLRFEGEDAQSFLQGQVSQDLDQDRSNGAWSLLLNADGTIVTSAWIRGSEKHWELLVPSELVDAADARLRRFLLRVDCVITRKSEAIDAPLRSNDERIEEGKPWSKEFSLNLAPHVFGAVFVAESVSFTKGCFTGQELVGRMDARGASMPWRFVRVKGPSIDDANELLRSVGPAGLQGITSAVTTTEGFSALGIAHRTFFANEASARHPLVLVEEIS